MTIAPLIYELLERHSQDTEKIVGPVAQLVEQLTLNQLVEGSSPSGVTKKIICQKPKD